MTRWQYRFNNDHPGFSFEQMLVLRTFAADLQLYFPSILNTPALRDIAFRHRLHRRIAHSETGTGIRFRVQRHRAFFDSLDILSSDTMVDQFRRGVKSVEFIGEEGVLEVASEIFDPALCLFELNHEDESYYMKLSETARIVVNFNRMLKAVDAPLHYQSLNPNQSVFRFR